MSQVAKLFTNRRSQAVCLPCLSPIGSTPKMCSSAATRRPAM